MSQKFSYVFEFDAEISKLRSKLEAAQKSLTGVMGSGNAPGIEKTIGNIEKAIGRLQEKAAGPITSESTFGSLQKESTAIGLRLQELTKQIGGLANLSKSERFELLPPDTQKKVEGATSAVAAFTAAREKAEKKSDSLISKERALAKVTKEKADLEAKISKNSTIKTTAEESARAIGREIVQLQARQKQLGSEEDALRRVEAARKAAEAAKASGASPAEISFESGLGDAQRHLDAVREVAAALLDKEQAQKAATTTAEKYSKTIQQDQVRLQGLAASYDKLDKEVKELEAAMKSGSSKQQTAAWKELRQAAESLGVSMDGIPVRRSQKAIDELLSRLNKLEEDGYKDLETAIEQYSSQVQQVVVANEQASTAIARGNEEFREQKQIMADRDAFVQRIKDFVGLRGAAMLARTTLRAAMQSVKELDAVMTEMSVVTDLSVGDYWDQLPEYTERASALGLSIKDAYEAATLFYQQGLKTNEVVAISNETLKMAKIAGLSAEDATNKMTAALRGFNMELNETSAQKVSDVYSQLAAITASDVNEISTAMTKTASIASSAGMEFETTAAFLSQIIETTRESAETAGTAMKTVIARFQELKKDPAEIGEIDGEIVDANKIETALRSVGVALRDSSGQFRDLDDVFLELSSKWNTLDTNTQRYIATIAAGSRQQSRFIAMMSDYGRTQELVSAANNSAGASNTQFQKTAESLEYKLNQLKNAWTTFTMGIMNSDAIKFGIDALTKILNVINNVTKGFGGFSGTISKLGLAFAAFKVGQLLVRKFSNTILGVFQQIGAEWKRELTGIQKDTTDTINNIGSQSPAQAASSALGKDGHYKTFRERVFEPVNTKNAVAKTSRSINTAVAGAEEGASLRETVAKTTVKGGARNGMAAGGYGFAENMSPAIAQDIKAQFTAALTEVKMDVKEIEVVWEQLESEIADMDIISAIDKIEAKMTELGQKAEETGGKTKTLTVTSEMQTGAQAEVDKKEPGLIKKVGSAVKDKVSDVSNTAARAKNAAKASQAIAKAQGESYAKTLRDVFGKNKVSFDQLLDLKSLDTIKKQFIQKATEMKVAPDQIETAWKELESTIKGNEDVISAIEEIDLKLEELGREAGRTDAEIEKLSNDPGMAQGMGQSAEEASGKLTAVGNALSNIGGLMTGVGAAFGMLGEIFRSMGLDWVADAFDEVGKVVMFVGSALLMIPPIISVINTALMTPPLGVILIIIGAIIAGLLLITMIVKGILNAQNAPAEALKEAQQAAEEAKETAQAAKEAYNDLLNSKSEYDSLVNTIESLTEGTTAWKNAVQELAEQITNLVELYPQLAQYVDWSKGYMSLEEEGWDFLLDQQSKKMGNAQGLYLQRQMDVKKFSRNEAFSNSADDINAFYDAVGGIKEGKYLSLENAISNAIKEYGLDSQEYNNAVAAMENYIEANGGKGKAEFQAWLKTNRIYQQEQEALENMTADFFRSVGSREAKASSYYNAIAGSLEGSYDTVKGVSYGDEYKNATNTNTNTAIGRANEKLGGQGKDEDEHFYNNGDNKTNKKLELLMAEEGLSATGVETADMAKLLEAKTGEVIDAETIEEKGKGADEMLAEKLHDAYVVEEMGAAVDEIYNLTKTNADVKDLYSGSLDVELMTDSEINALEDVTNVTKNALKNQVGIIQKARKDIDLELQKIFGDSGVTAKAWAGSYDQAKKFIDSYSRMMAGAGSEMAKSFASVFEVLTPEEQASWFNDYENVNWSSSIDGAAALNQMLDDSNAKIRVFAQSTLELESSFYSATSQANELYKSLGTDALQELASDGKISATEILELSKSNEKLATMLDNTGISASTLGTYFELLEDGTLDANSATDDFIRVLEKLGRASATIEDSFAFIDTWEPSRSSTEISESFGEMRDSMLELYNVGAFGDQALIDYISAFIGEENWEAILAEKGGNIQAAMEQVMNQVKDFGTNFQQVWSTLANSGGVDGISMGEDGTIKFDFSAIESTDALRQQIIDQGWSEEMADALIADAQTYGQNVKEGLKSLDIEDAFVDWISSSVKTVGDEKIIDQKQFEAFMKESGLDPEIAKAALEAQGIKIKSAISESGGLEQWVKDAIMETVANSGELDLGATYELLLDLGLNDEQAKAQLEQLAGEMTDVAFTLNGETVKEAGAELGTTTYQGVNYAGVTALMDTVEDAKVVAAQKKAAYEQATYTGEAMAAASVTAAQIGPVTMATTLETKINGVIDSVNSILPEWAQLGRVSIGSKMQANMESNIASARQIIRDTFASDIAEQNKIIMGSSVGYDSDAASKIYDEIVEKGGVSTPTTGTSYVDPADITSPTMDSEEGSDYETPYDWLFVLNQDLEDIMRKREKLERKYNKLLEDENSTIQEIVGARKDMLAEINKERQQQQKIITDTIADSVDVWKSMPTDLQKWVKLDQETGEVSVVDGYEDADIDPETREQWDEYIAALLDNEETIHGAQDSIEDLDDTADEILEEGRAESSDYLSRIKDALVADRQKEIDSLTEINDSINEAQDALYDQIQKNIDATRQERENADTEQDIADKEARLAYLKRDSSSANLLEIAALEEEIAEQKEDYRDTLIDQALTNLQDANAEAAEQREKQISLLESQLEAYESSEEIWQDAMEIFARSMEEILAGVAFEDTEMGKMLYENEVVDENLNPYEIEEWEKTNKTNVSKAATNYADDPSLSSTVGDESSMVPGKKLTAEVKLATATAADFTDPVTKEIFIHASDDMYLKKKDATEKDGNYIWAAGTQYFTRRKFLEGGLADFTGPAWLDGTKSSPELVLNATDTRNFIMLKDILSDILQGTSTIKKSSEDNKKKGGDNYYEIEINVDSLAEDYDVEQLADKIKSMIYEDSVYRNVNTVHLIR